jgi:hypothetical protein
MKKIFVYLVLFIVVFSSCKKNSNNKLQGKWKLVAVYNGYANGGNFLWNNISDENSHTLEFSDNGQYLRQENQNMNNQQCIGTYIFQTYNNLEINSNCNTVTEKMKISEISSTLLIIDIQVREGKIRYKYSVTI